MPKTRTLLALVLLPLLVFLVACGGSDDDDNGNGGSQPSANDSGGSSGGGSGGSGDSGGSGSSSSSSNSNNDVSGEEALENCPELANMFGAFAAGAFANPGAGGDAADDLEAVADVFQNAADNAPDEIKADMQLLANAFSTFYETLAGLNIDFSNPASFATLNATQQAQLQAAVEALDSAELTQASDNLDAWITENCS